MMILKNLLLALGLYYSATVFAFNNLNLIEASKQIHNEIERLNCAGRLQEMALRAKAIELQDELGDSVDIIEIQEPQFRCFFTDKGVIGEVSIRFTKLKEIEMGRASNTIYQIIKSSFDDLGNEIDTIIIDEKINNSPIKYYK